MEPLTIIPESELAGHKLISAVAIIALVASIIPWVGMIYLVRENDRLETLFFKAYIDKKVNDMKIDRIQSQGCFERFYNHPVDVSKKAGR